MITQDVPMPHEDEKTSSTAAVKLGAVPTRWLRIIPFISSAV